MIRFQAAVAAVAVLSLPLVSCDRSQPTADPMPTAAAQAAFAGCQWGKVKGSGLSVWAYACGPALNGKSLIADDEVGGFAVISDGLEPRVVIRSFAKPANAVINAALPAIRAASPGRYTATCVLTPMTVEGRGSVYLLSPGGPGKTYWNGIQSGNILPRVPRAITSPCGPLGIGGESSPGYFEVLESAPTKVVYVDPRSEIAGRDVQIFDASTLAAD